MWRPSQWRPFPTTDCIFGTLSSAVAQCNNDITVLEASLITWYIANAKYPMLCKYTIQNVRINKPRWLCDVIYPKAPFFFHYILNPSVEDDCYFARWQEGRRKDIERNIGVLQEKFHIVSLPSCLWRNTDMTTVIYACVILHNMIVSGKRPLVPLERRKLLQGSRRIFVSG